MLLITLIGIFLTLFGGFLLLTAYEARKGRALATSRARLDRVVRRATFVVTHVDWSAFGKHVLRTGADRMVHDVAHATLLSVRFLERTLTRAVRTLRERRAGIITTRKDGARGRTLGETLRAFRRSFKKKDASDAQ